MPVSIDRADLAKIARAAGGAGKPLPEFAQGQPELEKAYVDGGGTLTPSEADETADPAPTSTPNTPATSGDRSEPGHGKRPARTRAARKPSRSAAGRRFGGRGLSAALPRRASIGGVALALWVYPIVSAVLLDGPAGAGDWLKAKFLNISSGSLTSPATTTPQTTPTAPRSADPAPSTSTPKATPKAPSAAPKPRRRQAR